MAFNTSPGKPKPKRQKSAKAKAVSNKLRGAAEKNVVPTTHDGHLAGPRGAANGVSRGVPPPKATANKNAFGRNLVGKSGGKVVGRKKGKK